MSRALRRHPPASKPPAKAQGFRPTGVARPVRKETQAAATGESSRKRSLRAPRWATDIISELRKVSWPTREETTRLTFAVVVVSVSIGLALGGVDLGFNWLIEKTLLR
jgi:preprotein translocase subunit SecE